MLFVAPEILAAIRSVLGLQTLVVGLNFDDLLVAMVPKGSAEVSLALGGGIGNGITFLAVVVSRSVPTEILAAVLSRSRVTDHFRGSKFQLCCCDDDSEERRVCLGGVCWMARRRFRRP